MGKIEKLINKAKKSPQNLKFREFCSLLEYFDMECRNTSGSHRVYKRQKAPIFTLSIQDVNGMAKPYQIKQLFEKLQELGVLKERGK